MKIGFIGLGIMGCPMAAHLIDGGHELFVNDIAPIPDVLIGKGARPLPNARAVAEDGLKIDQRNAELRFNSAIASLRLGDETGQLPMLASRVAEFYEAKLQRTLDRVVGIAGPAAIIAISIVVGGLIVSVMTALLSVSQIVG